MSIDTASLSPSHEPSRLVVIIRCTVLLAVVGLIVWLMGSRGWLRTADRESGRVPTGDTLLLAHAPSVAVAKKIKKTSSAHHSSARKKVNSHSRTGTSHSRIKKRGTKTSSARTLSSSRARGRTARKPVESSARVQPPRPRRPRNSHKRKTAGVATIPRSAHPRKPVDKPAHSVKPAALRAATSGKRGSREIRKPQKTAAQKIDWANQAITKPVPGAFIVIYLKKRLLILQAGRKRLRRYRHIDLPTTVDLARKARGWYYHIAGKTTGAATASIRAVYLTQAKTASLHAAGRMDATSVKTVNVANTAAGSPPLSKSLLITSKDSTVTTAEAQIKLEPEEIKELCNAVRKGTWLVIKP